MIHENYIEPQPFTRVATLATINPLITAYELARLMQLSVSFSDHAINNMSAEDRELVLSSTRPA